MRPVRSVHVLVPAGLDDPARASGGNTYDRRLCESLADAGWSVRLTTVGGTWPRASRGARHDLGQALAAVPDGASALVDGLLASASPEILVPAARRVRLVALVHLPIGSVPDGHDPWTRSREAAVLAAATGVVTTSAWSRRWLLATYPLDAVRVRVARPGVDPARPATGTVDGGRLLCVGAVTPGKGHDVLLAALARVADLPWRCDCVGPLGRAPGFVARLRREVRARGLGERVVLTGPRVGRDLDASYDEADALVLASRMETYGMVVTEALARALPVVATDVGGVPESLGTAPDGRRPGLLSPPGDVPALAASLRAWLGDARLRRDLRQAARGRRAGLAGWSETAAQVGRALEVAAA